MELYISDMKKQKNISNSFEQDQYHTNALKTMQLKLTSDNYRKLVREFKDSKDLSYIKQELFTLGQQTEKQ